jgi:serine/threonine protein kinase
LGHYIFLSPRGDLLWIGNDTRTNEDVLIRIIPKNRPDDVMAKITAEYAVLRELDHPLLAKYHETLEDDHFLYIITDPPHSQSVRDFITRCGPVSDSQALGFFAEFAEISEYFEAAESTNFKVTIDTVYVDDDFHLVQFYVNLDSASFDVRFDPPEVLSNRQFTAASVVWSAAIFLFYITVGSLPFEGPDDDQIRRAILQSRLEIPAALSANLSALLGKMLTKNPITRIEMSQMASQPWVMGEAGEPAPVFVKLTHPREKRETDTRLRAASGNIKTTQSKGALRDPIRTMPRKSYGGTVARQHGAITKSHSGTLS